MGEVLRLERISDKTPWGFRLTGGYDFGTPLSVVKVTGGSIAANNGVKVGDIVTEINGQPTKHFIHKDAQNFIGISGNHITLTVLRGSLVTPPDVTPLRGRTPMSINEDNNTNQAHFNAHILNERLEKRVISDYEDESCDGLHDAPTIHENRGLTPELTNRVQTRFEGEVLTSDVTDTELDEVLTGNEEVLDEGIIGINFKKYFPQVDFIRQSEVFKFLQNENTKKDVPEEVQLEKEPTKRFSTFLQKPKPPPPKPPGPLWHYPKAPNYLPKKPPESLEEPHRRPKRESIHTVLWLFLGETGDNVVDERWGSEEEERVNLSRCEMREEDTVSLVSSITTGLSGRDSRLDKLEEIAAAHSSEHVEMKHEDVIAEEKVSGEAVCQEVNTIDREKEEIMESGSCKISSTKYQEESNENQTETIVFSKQIANIQSQIAALEIQAPSDLQTQLLAIQEQLSRIGEVKTSHVSNHQEQKDEHIEKREYYKDERTKVEEEEKCMEELSENYNEYTFECEIKLNRPKHSSGSPIERSSVSDRNDSASERGDSESDHEYEVTEDSLRGYEKGEYEICETPVPTSVQKKKTPAHPITPQMRPIVLPGGRMWRHPKDACHDDFYQGVLVAQAEVMIGNTGGVNFTKYVPPKFDMSHSAVYKLVHEIEDKTKMNEKVEKEYYHTPIGKRHFYAATLKEPDPIGGVDL